MRYAALVASLALLSCSDGSPAARPTPAPESAPKVKAPAPVAPTAAVAPPAAAAQPSAGHHDDYCTNVRLSKEQLCGCLGEPSSASASGCELELVGAGFGIFTADDATLFVTHEREGGLVVVGYLHGPGIEMFAIQGTHVVELRGKPVLWVDATMGDGNEDDSKYVYLCPARDPGRTSGLPQCLQIPLLAVTQATAEGTHEPIGPVVRSRFSIDFTPEGEVLVRSVGKLRHPHLKKLLGKHVLE
jgi:hypothetical protein